MTSEKFTVEIISPEKSIIKIETHEVIIPSYEGEMGILRDHIPLITFLRPGIVTIKNSDDKMYYVEEGTVEFTNNELLILSATAISIKDIKNDDIEKLIIKSEEQINKSTINDKERYLLSHKLSILKEIRK
tara:strand:+ start:219 stop:611 length:393 start_codon:yes stop_codon:yes gene_type:complete